jgi:hypothetical protein
MAPDPQWENHQTTRLHSTQQDIFHLCIDYAIAALQMKFSSKQAAVFRTWLKCRLIAAIINQQPAAAAPGQYPVLPSDVHACPRKP